MRGRIAYAAMGTVAFAAAMAAQAPATPPFDFAQGAPSGSRGARAAAPIDLTGYWVSVVTEDWRFRMVTPLKGDYGIGSSSVPLTPEGRKVADTWDLSKDGSCLAYGAAGLMRMPTRVRITWESDDVLKLETDAGLQTRRLLFDKTQPPRARSLQGHSVAQWESGSLKVITTNTTGGWLRRNGVPYSENVVMTEYVDRFRGPNDDEWFNVNTIVEDPKYLQRPFITSSHFKREPDGSKWRPHPCKAP